MNRRHFLLSLYSLGLTGYGQLSQAAAGLVVIAHPNNSVSSATMAELEAYFTTRKQYWPNGGRVQPFNFPAKHPVRVAFDEAVLGMNADEVARYWIDRRVRGGHRPPRQVPSAALMVRIVASLDGAIGYVNPSDVNSSVKVIAKV